MSEEGSSPRCAGYFTPAAGHPLVERASRWLGRDAFTGAHLDPPHLHDLGDVDVSAITADPRHYGFHATLRAPFEPSGSTADVCAAAAAFARSRRPFEIDVRVADLKGFLALVLARPSAEMQALHEEMLVAFEPVRAPLSAFDSARRSRGDADPAHDARLARWGYPHVQDHFTFHMTLTGRIRDDALRTRLRTALAEHFSDLIAVPLRVEGIAVFQQPDRTTPFTVERWTPFDR